MPIIFALTTLKQYTVNIFINVLTFLNVCCIIMKL